MVVSNKTVLVTGATRGIGLAIATSFLKKGYGVVGIYRNSDAQARFLKDTYPHFWPVKFDLVNCEGLEEMLTSLPSEFQQISILVNNAGIKHRTNFLETTLTAWNETIDVNLRTPYFLTQSVARNVIKRGERGGRIINITSQAAPNFSPDSLEYGLSKSGLTHFTKQAAKRLALHNITVNAISPGRTYTDLTNYHINPDKEQHAIKNIPLKHINSPQEVANIAMFLASESSNNITGQVIAIDGGEVIS